MAWIVIYIIGVVLVGGAFAKYIKDADEDVSLLDLMKMIVISFLSWLAVLFFVLSVVGLWIDEKSRKLIIKKGKKGGEI